VTTGTKTPGWRRLGRSGPPSPRPRARRRPSLRTNGKRWGAPRKTAGGRNPQPALQAPPPHNRLLHSKVKVKVVAVVGAEGMEVVDEVGEIVMAGEEGEDTKEVEAPFPGRILEEEVDLHQELQGVAD